MEQVRAQAADATRPPVDDEPAAEPAAGGAGGGGPLRTIARAVLWPLRRFFDPRIYGLAQAIEVTKSHLSEQVVVQGEHTRSELAASAERGFLQTQEDVREVRGLVEADLDAATEAATVIGQGVTEVRGITEALEASVRRIEQRLAPEAYRQLGEAGRVEDLDETIAHILNYASSHRGFAAQRNLWFNSPLSIIHGAGNVSLGHVNERIVEVAYAFRALAGVDPGAKVLDVGASESTVSLSLASLGYEVTALDPRPYPLEHPRLRVVAGGIEEWDPRETFAAVLCISTLEHIGVGAYGQAKGAAETDRAAIERIYALTDPGGLLVVTVPFGPAAVNELERTYDRERLAGVLDGWTVEELTIAEQVEPTVWVIRDSPGDGDMRRVALVTARRP
jgi:hypothetical protein